MTRESIDWPELPEGYFFRVKTGVRGQYPWVELRNKSWIGSYKIGAACHAPRTSTDVVDEIEWLARKLVRQDLAKHLRNKDQYWVGDSK